MADDWIRQLAVANWDSATVLRGEDNDVMPKSDEPARKRVDDKFLTANER
jgi:hypothetical protein